MEDCPAMIIRVPISDRERRNRQTQMPRVRKRAATSHCLATSVMSIRSSHLALPEHALYAMADISNFADRTQTGEK